MKKEKIPKWIRKLILNTSPQVGAYRSKAPSLSHIYFILGPLRDSVKICSLVIRVDETSSHASRCNILSDKVAIHFDVLGPLMKN